MQNLQLWEIGRSTLQKYLVYGIYIGLILLLTYKTVKNVKPKLTVLEIM